MWSGVQWVVAMKTCHLEISTVAVSFRLCIVGGVHTIFLLMSVRLAKIKLRARKRTAATRVHQAYDYPKMLNQLPRTYRFGT